MKEGTKQYSSVYMAMMMCAMLFVVNPCVAGTDVADVLTPEIYSRGIIPLTKGSSTTLQNTNGQPRTLVTVLALGQGTLKVTLTKKDTINDVVSVFLIGYPAEPAFVPGFGITPADVAVSAALTDALGGFGIFFIITTINSNETYVNSLALKLE